MRSPRLVMLCVVAATCLTGCGGQGKKPPAAGSAGAGTTQGATTNPALASNRRTLFDRLGGTAGVTKVIDDFVAIAAADPAVNFTRAGHPNAWEATPENVALLKKRLVQFVATATGGDQEYTGEDLLTAHKGMGITDAEFDASAAALRAAMGKHEVPAQEQAELLAVVNRTRSAIVEEQAAPAGNDAAGGEGAPAAPAEVGDAPAVAPPPADPAQPAPSASDVIEETELEPPAPREGDQPVKREPVPPTVEQGE